MSLSSCSRCWDTPCRCGLEESKYSKEYLIESITNMFNDRDKEEAMYILEDVKQLIKKKYV